MANDSYLPEEEQGGKGALVIIIIIIVLLIIGGLYAINTQQGDNSGTASTTDQTAAVDMTVATSTDLNSIDQDLNNLDSSSVDSGLNSIDQQAKGL